MDLRVTRRGVTRPSIAESSVSIGNHITSYQRIEQNIIATGDSETVYGS